MLWSKENEGWERLSTPHKFSEVKLHIHRTKAFHLFRKGSLLSLNWGDSWESLGLQGDQSILKEINTEYSLEELMLRLKLQSFDHRCKELTHGKRPWCWERLKAGWEGDDRGLDGGMASLTQWTWVWASSGRWWRTGKPGVLQSMGSQNWTQLRDWTTTVLSSQLSKFLVTN